MPRGNAPSGVSPRQARLALAFINGVPAKRYSQQIGEQKSAQILRLGVKFAAERQIRLLTRLLLRTMLGPLGWLTLAFDVVQLLRQLQEAIPEHWNISDEWEVMLACNRTKAHGPYPVALSPCSANKFVTEANKGQIQGPIGPSPSDWYMSFLHNQTATGSPSFVSGGTRVALMDSQYHAEQDTPPAIPTFGHSQPEQKPVYMPGLPQEFWKIQNMPSTVIFRTPAMREAVSEWPEAYRALEPRESDPTRSPFRWPGFESWKWEVEAPLPEPRPPTSRSRPEPRRHDRRVRKIWPRPEPYRPKPPPRKHLEAKMRARAGYALVTGVIGMGTEGLDLIEALYKSLDRKYKRPFRVNFNHKLRAVLEAIKRGEINIARAFEEIFWNNLEDMIYGRLGKKQAKAVQKLADQGLWQSPTGTTVGGSNRQDLQAATGIKSEDPLTLLRDFLEPIYKGKVQKWQ